MSGVSGVELVVGKYILNLLSQAYNRRMNGIMTKISYLDCVVLTGTVLVPGFYGLECWIWDRWVDGWGIHHCYCREWDVAVGRTDRQVGICLLRILTAVVEFLFLFRVASDESWMGVRFTVVGWVAEYGYSSVIELGRGEGYQLYIL